MRSSLSSLAVAGAVVVGLVSGSAHANLNGITGNSGKQGVSCSQCHTGGSSNPTVTIEGPTSLTAGQTGSYVLIVRGGPGSRAGMNVAASVSGATLNPGTGLRKEGSELTHQTPKTPAAGEARFEFTLVAPSTNGTVKLFGAGNSANGNNDISGDASATTTLDVQVTGGTDPGASGGDGEDEGGCAAAGGAPLLGAVLAVLAARRRRAA